MGNGNSRHSKLNDSTSHREYGSTGSHGSQPFINRTAELGSSVGVNILVALKVQFYRPNIDLVHFWFTVDTWEPAENIPKEFRDEFNDLSIVDDEEVKLDMAHCANCDQRLVSHDLKRRSRAVDGVLCYNCNASLVRTGRLPLLKKKDPSKKKSMTRMNGALQSGKPSTSLVPTGSSTTKRSQDMDLDIKARRLAAKAGSKIPDRKSHASGSTSPQRRPLKRDRSPDRSASPERKRLKKRTGTGAIEVPVDEIMENVKLKNIWSGDVAQSESHDWNLSFFDDVNKTLKSIDPSGKKPSTLKNSLSRSTASKKKAVAAQIKGHLSTAVQVPQAVIHKSKEESPSGYGKRQPLTKTRVSAMDDVETAAIKKKNLQGNPEVVCMWNGCGTRFRSQEELATHCKAVHFNVP
ncbi:hypothetical protein, variant [Spizellomyces punctatus DAOM BR117]|uniref:C2H2-type domain-containing protein n=1 Tax=Spizellomyces punctatus (strain DAOM BR117) TaxID=645134 RepID=A0A0L0HQM7_SPIPD|nr:hypothetical protein, variant [Spizellomyces punctatus DAOM BR117]KND03260.1 hypothetical protein, variant [Spizellomyces punctatus DAOM BR117]|eukprot:XP_016611299.1 hypothetical protein, variant [Spizellomyces punctatus DAOM BR117]